MNICVVFICSGTQPNTNFVAPEIMLFAPTGIGFSFITIGSSLLDGATDFIVFCIWNNFESGENEQQIQTDWKVFVRRNVIRLYFSSFIRELSTTKLIVYWCLKIINFHEQISQSFRWILELFIGYLDFYSWCLYLSDEGQEILMS